MKSLEKQKFYTREAAIAACPAGWFVASITDKFAKDEKNYRTYFLTRGFQN